MNPLSHDAVDALHELSEDLDALLQYAAQDARWADEVRQVIGEMHLIVFFNSPHTQES